LQNYSRQSMNAIAKHCKAFSREQVRACVRLSSAHWDVFDSLIFVVIAHVGV